MHRLMRFWRVRFRAVGALLCSIERHLSGTTGMTHFDESEPDGPLTPEEEAQASLLTAADVQRIDECLLSHTSNRWYKVARVVAMSMKDLDPQFPTLPAGFYSRRVKHLVDSGAIETAEDFTRMRVSKTPIPPAQPTPRPPYA